MARVLARASLLLMICGIPSLSAAQQSAEAYLIVQLLNGETREPISGAHVTIPELYRFWITDANGWATVGPVPPGVHRVEFSQADYVTAATTLNLQRGVLPDFRIQLLPAGRTFEILSSTSTGQGDASLVLRVRDSATRMPIATASVVVDQDRYWLTDENGVANLSGLEPGERQIEVYMLGYGSVRARMSFAAGASDQAEVRLAPQPITLDDVEVTVRTSTTSSRLAQTGFYQRAATGIGHHIDRLKIVERNPLWTTDLFRMIPGVTLVPTPSGDYEAFSSRGCGLGGGGSMRIYVDGVLWDAALDDLPVEWLEGAEVYVGLAQIPVQYSQPAPGAGQGGCGVILLWTSR